MSTESLVTGELEFRENAGPKTQLGLAQKEIISSLEAELECEIKWDSKWNEWTFQDVNWSSHIGDDTINNVKAILESNKDYIKKFELSIYYLSEPYIYLKFPEEE